MNAQWQLRRDPKISKFEFFPSCRWHLRIVNLRLNRFLFSCFLGHRARLEISIQIYVVIFGCCGFSNDFNFVMIISGDEEELAKFAQRAFPPANIIFSEMKCLWIHYLIREFIFLPCRWRKLWIWLEKYWRKANFSRLSSFRLSSKFLIN